MRDRSTRARKYVDYDMGEGVDDETGLPATQEADAQSDSDDDFLPSPPKKRTKEDSTASRSLSASSTSDRKPTPTKKSAKKPSKSAAKKKRTGSPRKLEPPPELHDADDADLRAAIELSMREPSAVTQPTPSSPSNSSGAAGPPTNSIKDNRESAIDTSTSSILGTVESAVVTQPAEGPGARQVIPSDEDDCIEEEQIIEQEPIEHGWGGNADSRSRRARQAAPKYVDDLADASDADSDEDYKPELESDHDSDFNAEPSPPPDQGSKSKAKKGKKTATSDGTNKKAVGKGEGGVGKRKGKSPAAKGPPSKAKEKVDPATTTRSLENGNGETGASSITVQKTTPKLGARPAPPPLRTKVKPLLPSGQTRVKSVSLTGGPSRGFRRVGLSKSARVPPLHAPR